MSKILIVEDDILISNAMSEILDNYKVFHAYDGKTALDMINNTYFDLILLDLLLPELDGIDIVKNILIHLTPMEYQLFYLLYKKQGQTISREQILDEIWGIECDINTRVVDVNIQKLRKKLNLKNEIITISKVGYRLENKNEA